MGYQSLSQRDLTSRALATGVPSTLTLLILSEWIKWVRCSGEEWAVSRLKAVKLDMVRKKAGLPPVSEWIAKGRRMSFSGPLGLLEAWMFKHPLNFYKGIQLLQIYTSKVARTVTNSQRTKFVSAVTSPPPKCDALDHAKLIITNAVTIAQIRPKWMTWRHSRIIDFPFSSTKRAPLIGRTSKPEKDAILDSLLFLTRTRGSFLHYLKYRKWYDSSIKELYPLLHRFLETDESQAILAKEWTGEEPADLVVGQIGLIQEPGYKLRAVANPGRVFQNVLKPLQKQLLHLVNSLPWDCTHDQYHGIPKIQEALSHGVVVHSIDLSNATDFFPLELQTDLLRKLYPGQEQFHTSLIDLFEEISRAKWWMPGYGYIQWERGQPLGLNPSFPAFALTHGLLLLGLAGDYHHQFFVLGDDVVIMDSDLKDRYIRLLDELGCPISEAKSLSSSSLAEFGGKLITKDMVMSQYKYKQISDDSFIDIARMLGPSSLRLFKPRQRRLIQRICSVPEFLGGLGWNPKGLPIEDRIQDWCFNETYHPIPRVTSLSKDRIHHMMESKLVQSVIEMDRKVCLPVSYPMPSDDLDQRSLDLATKYCPVLTPWIAISGKNLDVVFHLLKLELDLPTRSEGDHASGSALTVWERKTNTLS